MASKRSRGLGLAVGSMLALWLLYEHGAKAAVVNLPNLTGKVVDRKVSWTGSTKDWATTRFGAALAAVKAHGETDDAVAHQVALSILTHWSIETGAGAAEQNYNVGNILATNGDPYYIAKDVSGKVYAFRAFDDLTSGVEAYMKLLSSSRYEGALTKLGNKPEDSDWYIALGKAGWFNPPSAGQTWEQAAASYEARRTLLAQYATT